jgi:hypothetical protein
MLRRIFFVWSSGSMYNDGSNIVGCLVNNLQRLYASFGFHVNNHEWVFLD